MRRLGIRQRLVLTIGLACLVVLGAIALASVRTVRSELMARVDDDLVALAEGGVKAAPILTPEQGAQFRDLGPGDQSLVIADPSGVRAWSMAAGSSDADREALEALDLDTLRAAVDRPFTLDVPRAGADQRVVAAVLDDDRLLVYARSLAGVDGTVRDLAIRLVVACAVGLLALLGLVLWAGRRTVRPIEKVIATAGAVGEGDLNRRVDEDQPDRDTERLAGSLNAMLDQLTAALAAKDRSEARLRQFLSDASHELRTPLTTIRAHAELASVVESDEQRRRSVDKIAAESVRMSGLVEDLFILARLDQGQALHLRPTDLGAVVRDVVEDFRVVEPDRVVELLEPSEPVLVAGDAERLRQALDNVLANVRAHAGADTEVTVALTVDDDEVRVVVRDRGPGLGDGELGRAFERFYRGEVEARSRASGAGLGLAIVAAIVAGHDGRVTMAEAEPGVVVTLSLPRLASPAAVVPGEGEPASTPSPVQVGGRDRRPPLG